MTELEKQQAAVIEQKNAALQYAADAFRELAQEGDGDYETAEQMEAAVALQPCPEVLNKVRAEAVRSAASYQREIATKRYGYDKHMDAIAIELLADRVEKGEA